MKDNLKTITALVKDMLYYEPDTRNSDALLYVRICQTINPRVDKLSFKGVLLNQKNLGIPAFETVRRSRQKLQHDFPELAACDDVEVERELNEAVFRAYARS